MNNQNIIIYEFSPLYQILKELEHEINFNIIEALNQKSLNNEIIKLKNYIIVTKKKYLNIENQFTLNHLPIKIAKLIENLNIELLKQQFNDQSEIVIGNYKINLNAREMLSKEIRLKLTEKEINTILYLSKISNPVNVDELQTNVWRYHSDIETHTVETHIYRLRKKIFKTFQDENFIISKKNGYQIK
jgi:hypothetical protein